MFKKFESPLWYAYIQWPNVIDAITNCTVSPDSASRWGGRDKTCWDQLDCALSAADASQQAQYSSAATILGLVSFIPFGLLENAQRYSVANSAFNDGNSNT